MGEVKANRTTVIKAPGRELAGLGTGFGEGCTARGETWQIGGDWMCRGVCRRLALFCNGDLV